MAHEVRADRRLEPEARAHLPRVALGEDCVHGLGSTILLNITKRQKSVQHGRLAVQKEFVDPAVINNFLLVCEILT